MLLLKDYLEVTKSDCDLAPLLCEILWFTVLCMRSPGTLSVERPPTRFCADAVDKLGEDDGYPPILALLLDDDEPHLYL